jgi:hypothetical protein
VPKPGKEETAIEAWKKRTENQEKELDLLSFSTSFVQDNASIFQATEYDYYSEVDKKEMLGDDVKILADLDPLGEIPADHLGILGQVNIGKSSSF